MQWFYGPGAAVRINDNLIALAPTPLFHFEVADADAMHVRLLAMIRSDMAEEDTAANRGIEPGAPGIVTRNRGFPAGEAVAWQEQAAYVPVNSMLDRDHPDVRDLRDAILKGAAFVAKSILGGQNLDTRILSSWVQRYSNDDFHNMHHHKGRNFHPVWQHDMNGLTLWSGAYYIDDGGPDPHRDYSGVLTFNIHGSLFHVRPKPGLMLMWPSEVFHFVNPFVGARERVMLSWNLGFFRRES